jgi:hypothetical protein
MRGLTGDFILTFLFLAALATVVMLVSGCATPPKTETGAVACRGTAFAINPVATVQAEVPP